MAVDTRNKRFSMVGLDQWYLNALPNPDGTINAADRQQHLHKYAGIAFGAAGGGAGTPIRMMTGMGL